MSFNRIERTPLNLSIVTMLSFWGVTSSYAQDSAEQIKPASSQACVALESNADRLACYDALFKVPDPDKPVYISEQRAAQELESTQQPKTLTDKIEKKVENLFSVHGAKVDPNTSLLDKRWELSEDSKLGTWNIRAHQPVYLLPAFWTSKKNEFPQSPNPENTVDEDQNLKSMEAKFQISLKTKALRKVYEKQ